MKKNFKVCVLVLWPFLFSLKTLAAQPVPPQSYECHINPGQYISVNKELDSPFIENEGVHFNYSETLHQFSDLKMENSILYMCNPDSIRFENPESTLRSFEYAGVEDVSPFLGSWATACMAVTGEWWIYIYKDKKTQWISYMGLFGAPLAVSALSCEPSVLSDTNEAKENEHELLELSSSHFNSDSQSNLNSLRIKESQIFLKLGDRTCRNNSEEGCLLNRQDIARSLDIGH